jgi:hypothetical protein
MKIKTIGKPVKADKKICLKAVRWMAHKLLGPRLYDKIYLDLVFSKKDFFESKMHGYCEPNDGETRARFFTIAIDPTLNNKQMLMALAHELVHLKQYAKGELIDYVRTSHVKWRGEKIDESKINYWETPWEIEAYGREKGLYHMFKLHLKVEKDMKRRLRNGHSKRG